MAPMFVLVQRPILHRPNHVTAWTTNMDCLFTNYQFTADFRLQWYRLYYKMGKVLQVSLYPTLEISTTSHSYTGGENVWGDDPFGIDFSVWPFYSIW
jgi:hypothetical protein